MFAQAIETMTELQTRSFDGIDVRLLWSAEDRRVAVAVDDAKTGESFVVEVRQGDSALDAFHHPFAYAAWHGTVDDLALAA